MKCKYHPSRTMFEYASTFGKNACQPCHKAAAIVSCSGCHSTVGFVVGPIDFVGEQACQPHSEESGQVAVLYAVVVGRIGHDQIYRMIVNRQVAGVAVNEPEGLSPIGQLSWSKTSLPPSSSPGILINWLLPSGPIFRSTGDTAHLRPRSMRSRNSSCRLPEDFWRLRGLFSKAV